MLMISGEGGGGGGEGGLNESRILERNFCDPNLCRDLDAELNKVIYYF
jgi:hypothetical protein